MVRSNVDVVIIKGKCFKENGVLMVQEYDGDVLLLGNAKSISININLSGEPFSLYDYIAGLPKENKIGSIDIRYVTSSDISILVDQASIIQAWDSPNNANPAAKYRNGEKSIQNDFMGNIKPSINELNIPPKGLKHSYCYMEIYIQYI